jgi:hypothetical protein
VLSTVGHTNRLRHPPRIRRGALLMLMDGSGTYAIGWRRWLDLAGGFWCSFRLFGMSRCPTLTSSAAATSCCVPTASREQVATTNGIG